LEEAEVELYKGRGGQRSIERLGCKMTHIKVGTTKDDVDSVRYATRVVWIFTRF
jgi:hypothetical protein